MYKLRGAKRKEKFLCPVNYTWNFRIGHFAQDFLEFLSFSSGCLPVNHSFVKLLENLQDLF